jgi:ribosome-associated protein
VRSSTLAKQIAELTLTKKAHDVLTLDLRKLSPVSDFFVVCSADSDSHARAIADAVEEGMEKKGSAVWHREAGSMSWVVLDYVDVVVHIFQKAARSYYNLERLWGDAKIVAVNDTAGPPARGSRTASPGRATSRKGSSKKTKSSSKKGSSSRRKSTSRRTATRIRTKAAS